MQDFQEIINHTKKSKFYKNTLARLGAIQTIYVAMQSKRDLATSQKGVKSFFIEHSDERETTELPNFELFDQISEGVYTDLKELDELIKTHLPEHKDYSVLDEVQKIILMSGVYELQHHLELNVGVIINDYINITKSFYNGREYQLTNAFLDKVAKVVRI
jgi:N utilization substance protein B